MFPLLIDSLLRLRSEGPVPAAESFDQIPRALLAAICGCGLMLLLGGRGIEWLRTRFREPIKSDSATISQLHAAKASTPTLGGLLFLAAFAVAVLLLADLTQPWVACSVLAVVGFGLVGMIDDLIKLFTPRHGLGRRGKLIGQFAAATVVAVAVYGSFHESQPESFTPGPAWIALAMFVLVAAANAVNLTDGLDGLASGCTILALPTFGGLAFAGAGAGSLWCTPHGIPGAAELLVPALAMTGAMLGFLWFNRYPAKVFMGDCGSQPLGALLAVLALSVRQEWLLLIVGGVFVLEAASVAIQIGWFKCTGRRVFRCAPLHHHFQFAGWSETKIVARFWMVAFLCAVLGIATVRISASWPTDETPTPRVAGQVQLRR